MNALTCDQPFTISGGVPTCPGNLGSFDMSIFTPFDPSMLDPIAIINAFGSGFILAGIPFLTVMCARIVISTLKGKKDEY